MKTIALQKLTLRDFQGGNFVFEPDGKDAFIFGENAVGKTRLVSAFTWLLFNKDALGRADFEIKNLDAQGEAAHGLEHAVGAELIVNGQIVFLEKIFQEKWQKKRGSANREFTGHTTSYSIDGVPIQEKDYNARISEMTGDESRFRLLTSPMVFPALHWQKQRALLLEVCGDLSDTDVIASNEKLSSLTAILGKHSLDDHRKIVTARRTEINKELEKIPVRIDEVRRTIPDLTGLDQKTLEEEVKQLEASSNDAKLKLQGTDTGGKISEFTKKVSGLNADRQKMEESHRSKSLAELNRLNQQISELSLKITSFNRSVGSINNALKVQLIRLQSIEPALDQLRKQWVAIDAEQFKDTTIDICPACRQSLPVDRIKEAKEKALANFNQDKAERLGEIDRKGHALKDEKIEVEKQANDQMAERDRMQIDVISLEKQLQSLEQDRYSLTSSSENFSGLQGYADLLDEIEDWETQISAERAEKVHDSDKIKQEISVIQSDLSEAKSKVDMFIRKEQGEKRIEELLANEKKLATEFERLEGELYLMDQFIKTKVSMLTDRINSKFEMVRFKLFNQLINGGIEEVCEITVNGVPFNAGLNSAARTQAGMDIIRTLQQHFEMQAPIFIDNREGCTEIPKMRGQVISLYVSPEDKVLRVEVQEPEKRKRIPKKEQDSLFGA